MESSVSLEVMYIMVTINNTKVLELDKLNAIYVLNEKDMMAVIRTQC